MGDDGRRSWNSGRRGAGPAGAVYGMGFLGALVYYLQTAPSFWWGVWGVVKSLFWPAFLVYESMWAVGA